MMLFRLILMTLLAIAFFGQPLSAQNWPQWRGPNRDGHVEEFAVPEKWPDSLRLVWKVETGAGLSSPVVSEGKIYVLAREGDDEVVLCFRLSDGSAVWRQSYATPFVPNPQAVITRFFPNSKGKGPFATPIVHGDRLYTLGVDRVLSCFNKNTGELQWRRHFLKKEMPAKIVYECQQCGCSEDGKEFDQPGKCSACGMQLGPKGMETTARSGIGNYYGAAASPLIHGNIGIISIGNPDSGAVLAFDLESGKEKWRRPGPPVSSSSPIIASVHGVTQVIVLTRESLAGLAIATGQLLWNHAIESNAQIITPIVFEDLVIYAAYRSPITAIKIRKQGTAWSAEQAWSVNEITLEMSTPVLVGDKLYGFSYAQRGQFFAMAARTGKTLWTSAGRQAGSAALLHTGGALIALTNEAKLLALARSETEYQPLASYEVADSPTWAHPVLWGSNILIKDETHLACWRME